jgi:DNA-binding transcriptional regulator YiaG
MKKAKKKPAKKEAAEPLRFAETAEPMSGEAFRLALEKIGGANFQSAFARLIGVRSRAVRTWISGEYPVPMPVGYLVSLMIKTKTAPEDLKL